MGNYNEDDMFGKIAEMAVLQELAFNTKGVENGKIWKTKSIYHIDGDYKKMRMVKYLQDRGADLVEIEEEYQHNDGTVSCEKTGKIRITFHEAKAETGTIGVYGSEKAEGERRKAIDLIEQIRTMNLHGIKAGRGNLFIETTEERHYITKEKKGWYWKYKNFYENEIPADTDQVEFKQLIWKYIIQAEPEPYGSTQRRLIEDKPAFLLSNNMGRLIEIIDRKLNGSSKNSILIGIEEFVEEISKIDIGKFIFVDPETKKPREGDRPFQNFITAIKGSNGELLKAIDKPDFGDTNIERCREGIPFIFGWKQEDDSLITKMFVIGTRDDIEIYTTKDKESYKKLEDLLKEYGVLTDDI